MKKKLINFKELSERLSAKELKNVLGGSGDGNDGECVACIDFAGTIGCECKTDAAEAAEYAGENGWWCCNCPSARGC